MVIRHDAYLTNTSTVNVTAGNLTSLSEVRLTGTGVIAGQVIGFPGGIPLGGADISVCSVKTPTCSNFTTQANQEGVFWALAPPGTDIIDATFGEYASNVSIIVQVASDSWEWVGQIGLYGYATVTGTLLGIPSGLALPGANVSFCSTLVQPGEVTGPCFTTVQTNPIGQFTISAEAGTYILQLNDSGYAPTYLPVSLTPGEQVQLGSVLLLQDGTLSGTVVGSDTLSPVAGTLIVACTAGVTSICTPTYTANVDGAFSFPANPGVYVLVVSAPGYEDRYLGANVQSGFITSLNLIQLTPIGTDQLYTISGSVIATNSSAPIVGASVISAGGYVSAPTNEFGDFSIQVPWGTYDFVARAAGYEAQSQNVTAHADVTGVDFLLAPTAYTFSGLVTDGLTGSVVSGADIETEYVGVSSVIATSDADGLFSAVLSNGSYSIVLQPPGTGGYVPQTFPLSINGANVSRNLSLYPPQTVVDGLVVDASTGLPVIHASIMIVGTTVTGIPWNETYSASSLGTVSASVYSGTYTIEASASGYASASQSVAPRGSSQQVVFSLNVEPTNATTTPAGSGSSWNPTLAIGAVVAVGALALVAVALITRRQRLTRGGAT
ncbi:MAG: carboxypeptidase-like regulatory domain-containing protein [Thermoplasmata archaeon]|nr:carboxypeptidase-like regulatory domain-containing protein [Thermoplasmata archaeon]